MGGRRLRRKTITSPDPSDTGDIIRQNLHNRTRPRSQGYEYPCHISKWSVKIYGRESVNGDFPCAKLKNFFWRLWKNPELILINMFRSTYMPNLVTLAWKMSSGMSKEAGSLNGPLCAYLMRQNIHDRTCLRSKGNKCPCQVWQERR